MKKIRFTFIALTLVLLMPAMTLFTACSAASDHISAESSAALSEESETAEATVTEPALKLSSELDFEGYTFHILTQGDPWAWEEVDVSEEKGTVTQDVVVNEAVTARNYKVAELLDINIQMVQSNNMEGDIKKSIMAADNAFDVALPNIFTAANLTLKNYFLNWKDIPNIDLSNPWYDQGVVRDLAIDRKNYFMTGDFGFRDKDNTWIFMFNKDLFTKFSLTEPYDLVRAGKWTLEEFTAMIRDTTIDLDGNGKYNKEDQFGFLTTGAGGAENFLFASDQPIVTSDADGTLSLSVNTDKTVAIAEKVYGIFFDNNQTHTDDWLVIEQMFSAGKGLFYSEIMAHIRNLRNMEANFGLLPSPKFDESQEKYLCLVDGSSTIMTIPITAPDTERTGAITEALFYYGRQYVRKAYFDISITSKLARDEDSGEMLNIILGGRKFDIGYIYQIGGFQNLLPDLISKKTSDFASYYAKAESKAQNALQKLMDNIAAMQ